MSFCKSRPRPHIAGVILGVLVLALGLSFIALRPFMYRHIVWLMDNFIWPNQIEIRSHGTTYRLMPRVGAVGLVIGGALAITSFVTPQIVTRLVGAARSGIDALVSTATNRDELGRRRLKPSALISPVVSVTLAVGLLLLRETPGLLREDGPTEGITSIAHLLASVLLVTAAYRKRGSIHSLATTVYLILAVGAFVVGMEEISWSQRVLRFKSPTRIVEINDQDELTVHNIGKGGEYFEKAATIGLAGAIGLGLLAIFLDYSGRSSPLLRRLLPPPWLLPPLAIILTYLAFNYEINRRLDAWYTQVVPETREMMLGLCVLLYAIWANRPVARDEALTQVSGPDVALT